MSRLDDAVAQYMQRKREQPDNVVPIKQERKRQPRDRRYHSARVARFDAHINVAHYVARWGRRPSPSDRELWLVMRAGSGWAQWFDGEYRALARALDSRQEWLLYGVTQVGKDDDPKGFVTQLK